MRRERRDEERRERHDKWKGMREERETVLCLQSPLSILLCRQPYLKPLIHIKLIRLSVSLIKCRDADEEGSDRPTQKGEENI